MLALLKWDMRPEFPSEAPLVRSAWVKPANLVVLSPAPIQVEAKLIQLSLPNLPERFEDMTIDTSWMLTRSGTPRTAFNPRKVPNWERAKWAALPPGWDAGWPGTRDACDPGPRPCPHCAKRVVMRANEGQVRCPACRRRVVYVQGESLTQWAWVAPTPHAPLARLADGTRLPDHTAFNRTRPCPWTRCAAHNYTEVTEAHPLESDTTESEVLTGGTIHINHPGILPDQLHRLVSTCSIDDAEFGEGKKKTRLTHPEIGLRLGITPQRVEQLEKEAMAKMGGEAPLVQISRLEGGRRRARSAPPGGDA